MRPRVVALLQSHNLPQAVQALRWAMITLRMVGDMLPAHGYGKNLGAAEFHLLYGKAERLGVPIAIHVSSGIGDADVEAQALERCIAVRTIGHSFPHILLTGMIFGSIAALFPRLQLMYLKAVASWVLYWMGCEYDRGWWKCHCARAKLSVYAGSRRTFSPVRRTGVLLPVVAASAGEEVLLCASDYPPWGYRFPDSARQLWERNGRSERRKRTILSENGQRGHGLE